MPDPLTPADLERLRDDHGNRNGRCYSCIEGYDDRSGGLEYQDFPCDAAKLLAELERMWLACFPAYVYGPHDLGDQVTRHVAAKRGECRR